MVVTICFRRASIPYCPNIRTVEKLAESDWAGHDNLGLAAVLRSCYFIADSVDLVPILVTEKSDPTKTARNRPNLQFATHTLKSQKVNRSEPCITRGERALVGTPKRALVWSPFALKVMLASMSLKV